MEHAYKLLYLLRPVIWGLFVFLIGVYGNRFYKKLLTIISAFLAIISVGGVALSTHLINHALTAYNMGEYVERNDFVLCYVGVTMTILLLVCSIGYGLMASTVDTGVGKEAKKEKNRKEIVETMKLLPIPVSIIVFSVVLFTLEEVAGKIFGVVLELVGWFWLICVIKYVKNKNADKENANNDSDN